MLRGAVRELLPSPAIDQLRLSRDKWRLNRVDRLRCETSSLPVLEEIDVKTIMQAAACRTGVWERVVGALQSMGLEGHVPGSVNPGDRRALSALVDHLRPNSVLEMGTHTGTSALTMAATLRALDFPGRIVTVDIMDVNAPNGPWTEIGMPAPPRELAARLGSSQVDFHVASSLSFLRETDLKFDLIFLDGDHAASAVYREVPLALRHLLPGGWLLLHDYFPRLQRLWPASELIHGPWLGTERLRREGAALRAIPLGELPWETKHGTRITSLAALARMA